MGAVRVLGSSPMRFDLYLWLTYRMSYLESTTGVTWEQLNAQFGSQYTRIRAVQGGVPRKPERREDRLPGTERRRHQEHIVLHPSQPHVRPDQTPRATDVAATCSGTVGVTRYPRLLDGVTRYPRSLTSVTKYPRRCGRQGLRHQIPTSAAGVTKYPWITSVTRYPRLNPVFRVSDRGRRYQAVPGQYRATLEG